jgi:magnesium-transporting ATPase (P-type)
LTGDIVVGDIVKVTKTDHSDPKHPLTDSFPADLVFLAASNPKGNGFVETASLDGETNLKNRQACHVTHALIHSSSSQEEEEDRLSQLKFTVRCEAPNADLRKFKGFLWVHEAKDVPAAAGTYTKEEGIELKTDALMLRNTNLRNTAYMYGLVVYTGVETKIRQNISAESKMRIKRSSVMRRVDVMLAGMFGLQVDYHLHLLIID